MCKRKACHVLVDGISSRCYVNCHPGELVVIQTVQLTAFVGVDIALGDYAVHTAQTRCAYSWQILQLYYLILLVSARVSHLRGNSCSEKCWMSIYSVSHWLPIYSVSQSLPIYSVFHWLSIYSVSQSLPIYSVSHWLPIYSVSQSLPIYSVSQSLPIYSVSHSLPNPAFL